MAGGDEVPGAAAKAEDGGEEVPVTAEEVEVLLECDGEEKAVKVPVDGKLELAEIGKQLFSLFPPSVASRLGRCPSTQEVMSTRAVLPLSGQRAFFAPGTTGQLCLVGPSKVVHIKERLHWGFLPDVIHAYSVTVEGCDEPLVLKLFYTDVTSWDNLNEFPLLEDICRLRVAEGVECHSLPVIVIVEHGVFATGDTVQGIDCVVLKLHVPPLSPSRFFSGRQLCNAAFDLLAIHHLRIVHCNVLTVDRSDILFVDEHQVFIFANLGKTQYSPPPDGDAGAPAQGLLVTVTLLLTLAALSGMRVTGLDEVGYPNKAEVANAAALLREHHDVLGDFADALVCLPPINGKIDYENWLLALARVCDRSPAMIRKPRLSETAFKKRPPFLQTAFKRLKLGLHQPWKKKKSHDKLSSDVRSRDKQRAKGRYMKFPVGGLCSA